jgi:hypothetical protein
LAHGKDFVNLQSDNLHKFSREVAGRNEIPGSFLEKLEAPDITHKHASTSEREARMTGREKGNKRSFGKLQFDVFSFNSHFNNAF